ncbi:MAG: adenylosuccinate lyase family protein [Candidatus Dormiibacterota bacterium]
MVSEEAGATAPGADFGAPLGLFGSLDTTLALAAATSDQAWLQALLDFEAGLAFAEAAAGVIPGPAAIEIAARCQAANFDVEQLGRAAPAGGNPVIPLILALMDQLPESVADWVHWGATSQDALDTAMMLVAQRSCRLILEDLEGAAQAGRQLAERHRSTLQVGRTLLQHAVPTTFGLKVAEWLTAIVEVQTILGEVAATRLAVQLGGAAGTLASLNEDGTKVVTLLAGRLGLAEPLLPWHTDRVRPAQLAAALGLVAGVAAKVAQDVVLLSQTELGEVSEAAAQGRGGSSTMPQKRNATDSVAITTGYRRINGLVAVVLGGMAQELERSAGDWQAEWTTVTELLRLTGGVAHRLRNLLEGLKVDESQMAANLALTRGGIMAERIALRLSLRLGRGKARQLVEEAAQRSSAHGSNLVDELAGDPEVAREMSPAELDELGSPHTYLGAKDVFIDRALAQRPGETQEDA